MAIFLATVFPLSVLLGCDALLMPRTHHAANSSAASSGSPGTPSKACDPDPCAALPCPGTCYYDWTCQASCDPTGHNLPER